MVGKVVTLTKRVADARDLSPWVEGAGFLLGMTFLARVVGAYVPILGASISGLILGILARNLTGVGSDFQSVIGFANKRLLKLAIILLGAGLSLQQVATLGVRALVVIIPVILLGLTTTLLLGKLLGIPWRLSSLIGVGTAICGATAILTTGPAIDAEEEEIAFAVSTIFLFNLLALLFYPLIAHVLTVSNHMFGVWAGTAIHDTSSVVAAGFSFSDQSGEVATVVKLTRTLFLIPVSLGFAVVGTRLQRNNPSSNVDRVRPKFPVFILGFLGMSLIATLNLIPSGWVAPMYKTSKFLIVIVLVSVGLNTDLRKLRRIGLVPFYIGLGASVVVAFVSFFLSRFV